MYQRKGRPLSAAVWGAWLFTGLVFCASTANPYYLGILFLAVLVIAKSYHVEVLSLIKYSFWFGLPMLIINLMFIHSGTHVIFELPKHVNLLGVEVPMIFLGGPITYEAALNAIFFMVLMLDMFIIFSIFNKNISSDELLRSIPKSFAGSALITAIAIRFTPTISSDAKRILDIQKSRGMDLSEGSIQKRVKRASALLIPVVVVSLERAYNLAQSLEARGYGGDRTSAKEVSLTNYERALTILFALMIITNILFAYLGYLDFSTSGILDGNVQTIHTAVIIHITMFLVVIIR